MAALWHFSKDGVRQGPVSGARLKELAEQGRLARTDLVWSEGMPDWRTASSVKGLFPEPQAPPTKPPPLPTPTAKPPEPAGPPAPADVDAAGRASSPAVSGADGPGRGAAERAEDAAGHTRPERGRDQLRRLAESPLAAATALVVFFPLGLYLVWRHPRWDRSAKWALTGVGAALFVVVLANREGAPAGGDGGLFAARGGSSRLTKAEFREKVKSFPAHPDDGFKWWGTPTEMNRTTGELRVQDFYDAFGRPFRTQTIGNNRFWYWQCSDGVVQVIGSEMLSNDKTGKFAIKGIDDY